MLRPTATSARARADSDIATGSTPAGGPGPGLPDRAKLNFEMHHEYMPDDTCM